MRKTFTHQAIIAFALATCLVQADKITLKGGKVIEGEIISETDTQYIISVAFSKSIRERKPFLKSDIISIEKEAPDKKPFEALGDILPTPDQLSIPAYKQLIDGRVKPFLNKFPKSSHAGEVKKLLKTLEEELTKAEAGDLKINGTWIAADDWAANALELDGQLLVTELKKKAAKRSYRQALILYDEIQVGYRGSDALNDARKITAKILSAYQIQVQKLADTVDEKKAKRIQTLKAMGRRDAARVKKARADEDRAHKARLAKAVEGRVKWLPLYEFDKRTIQTVLRTITSELRSLQRPIKVSRGGTTSEMYRTAWAAATRGDKKATDKALGQLRSMRVDKKYEAKVKAQLTANQKEEPTEPEPDPEALAKAAAAKKAAEEKAAEEQREKEKARERNRRRNESQAMDEEPVEEESSGLGSILPVVIGLALLGVLVTFLIKKRKESEE